MVEYHGIVNNGRIFITKTISQLKRLASREANNTFYTKYRHRNSTRAKQTQV